MKDCEMCKCSDKEAPWHQIKPVDRYLCNECALEDIAQAIVADTTWHGMHNPIKAKTR